MALTDLVALPRLFIQPQDWSEHVRHIILYVVLIRGKGKMTTEVPDMLDRLD